MIWLSLFAPLVLFLVVLGMGRLEQGQFGAPAATSDRMVEHPARDIGRVRVDIGGDQLDRLRAVVGPPNWVETVAASLRGYVVQAGRAPIVAALPVGGRCGRVLYRARGP